jgi:hypothetical protein
MTRRSRRELERALADLTADAVEENDGPPAWKNPIIRRADDGDGYVTHPDGEPVPTTDAGDPNPPGEGPVIVIDGRYTMDTFDDARDT